LLSFSTTYFCDICFVTYSREDTLIDKRLERINMFKYTKHFLKKVEDLFSDIEYTIRYERGSFQSGYCIVEDKKVAVINRFFETEARINVLLEILDSIEIDTNQLDEPNLALYKVLVKEISKKQQAENSDTTPESKDKANTKSVSEGKESELEEAVVENQV